MTLFRWLRGWVWKHRLLRYVKRHQCRLCGEFAEDGVDIGCMNRVWSHRECAHRVLAESRMRMQAEGVI